MTSVARKAASGLLGGLLAFGVLGTMPMTAQAETVSKIQAQWSGNVGDSLQNLSNAEFSFQVNVNDTNGATGVAKDFTTKVTTTNSTFNALPQICIKDSAISEDGKTLTCNLGDVAYGTAINVTTAVRVEGHNGDLVSPVVTGPDGKQQVVLTPKPIVATPSVDVYSTGRFKADITGTNPSAITKVPVGITIPVGGESLSDHIEFDLKIIDDPATNKATQVMDLVGCEPHDSSGSLVPYTDPKNFPAPTCTVTRTAQDSVHVVLDGMRTSYYPQPTNGSNGAPLPTDRIWVTGVNLVFKNNSDIFAGGHQSFSMDFESTNIKATTWDGRNAPEVDPTNQRTKFIWISPGNLSAWWSRHHDLSTFPETEWSGEAWTMPGDDAVPTQVSHDEKFPNGMPTSTYIRSLCVIIDNTKSVFTDLDIDDDEQIQAYTNGAPATLSYLTVPVAEPNNFNCADNSQPWTTTVPASNANVSVMRLTWDQSKADLSTPENKFTPTLYVDTTVLPGAPGNDVWTWGAIASPAFGNINSAAIERYPLATLSRPSRYATTNSLRDVVYLGTYRAASSKSSDVSVVNPGDKVKYTVTGAVNSNNVSGEGTFTMRDVMPAGVSYVDGSASIAPTSVTKNPNGTTTLAWDVKSKMNTNTVITYQGLIASGGNQAFTNILTVKNTIQGIDPKDPNQTSTATATVNMTHQGKTELLKSADAIEFVVNGSNIWNVDLKNLDAVPQEVADMIDILPYNGDANGSKFVGEYSVDKVTTTGVDSPVIYYTDADPKTLVADPKDPSNGDFGAPSALWTTTKPAKVTAIRVIGKNLPTGGTMATDIAWTTTHSASNNLYNNLAVARTTHTQLDMIKAAASTMMAEGSSLQIDKTLQPGQHARAGENLKYNITVKNNGKGNANDVVVTEVPGVNLDPASIVLSDMSKGTADGVKWSVGMLAPGETATATVTATLKKDANLQVATTNDVIVENPSNPHVEGCVANTTVDADTDQCDSTPLLPADINLQINKQVVKEDIREGGSIDYKIEVKNAGLETAYDVVVKDIPGANLDPKVTTWTIDALAPGEIKSFDVTVPVKTAAAGTKYSNGATVENPDKPLDPNEKVCTPNDTVDADDDQCDEVPSYVNYKPAIQIVKYINGDDANTAPGVNVKVGEDMKITYLVTNIGDSPLKNVKVTDDKIAADKISCPKTELPVGEKMTCTATLKAPAKDGEQHTNKGTVTGDSPDNPDGTKGKTVIDDDIANAITKAEPTKPGIVTGGDPHQDTAGFLFAGMLAAGAAGALVRRKVNS